jgi:hypothetical protein
LFRAPVVLDQAMLPIVVADFDGDGNLDIAGGAADARVQLLLGVGDGRFQPGAEMPGGNGPASIGAADFNGDGRLDIVMAYSGVSDQGTGDDDILVFLAKDDGSFEALVQPAGVNPQALVVGDFNEDEVPDLATANGFDYLSIFAGLGDGTFADPENYPINARFASGIAAADFDGDGNLDLVTTNSMIGKGRSDRTMSVLLGAGDGTFGEPQTFPVSGPQPIMPVVGDFNGDGFADVASPDGYPTRVTSVLLGLGNGALRETSYYLCGPNPHTLATADLDGDGILDLVCGNAGEEGGPVGKGIAALFGLGDGTFKPGVDLVGNQFGEGIAAAADLDNDGQIDLIVYSDTLVVLFNDIPR